MFNLDVVKGKLYLLRIINAAMNIQLFFKIANHKMTVVAADAVYTKPYLTDVIAIAPGQTVDALLYADQSIGSSYYMAAHPYASAPGVPFPNTTTRGVIHYTGGASKTRRAKRVLMPKLPSFFDTPTAFRFYSNLTSLVGGPHWVPVPRHVDEEMLVTIGLGLEACADNKTCPKFSASMNNHSFVLPKKLSILEAVFNGVQGIFTPDFPNQPPVKFNYTDPNITQTNPGLLFAQKSTSAKVLKFNATVDLVLQNHALIAAESHPMHLHGFNFHVLAQGFGNYDPTRDRSKYNLVNPQSRNTLAVPVGGWAVTRFRANNPGNSLYQKPVSV